MSWRYFLIVFLVLAGCGLEYETIDSATVLATVVGKAITTLDLDRYEQKLPDYLRSKKEGVAAHHAHLQSLVDKELVLREARKRGLDQLPVLKHELSKMVNKRLVEELSREMVDAQLTITEEELRTIYEKDSLGWEIWPAHILLRERRRRPRNHPPAGCRG